MKPRLRALLLHGLGHDPSWWEPVSAALEELGVATEAVFLPPLEGGGPEGWVETVVRRAAGEAPLLIGHSLGAAVALQAARNVPTAGLVLLACPSAFGPAPPRPPAAPTLSLTALVRVAQFLRKASLEAGEVGVPTVHFVGDADPLVSLEHAARLPHPVVTVPGATHDLNESAAFRRALCRHVAAAPYGRDRLDPAVRSAWAGGSQDHPAEGLELGAFAPPPARLDVELTTRCQLSCRRCARTLLPPGGRDRELSPDTFERVLEESPWARELLFVGLGEPLLHPEVESLAARAAGRGLETKLVTNGLLATSERLAALADCGLAEVTFSLDATEPALFADLRGGASAALVLAHFKAVPPSLRKSIFVTLGRENVGQLPSLIDLAADEGLRALAVSDVNFAENQTHSLHAANPEGELVGALRHARERGVLLITPRFHDVGDAPRNYRRCLARLPSDLTARSGRHRNCLAPWRVAVVGADGTLTPCNCAPSEKAGSVAAEGLAAVWNGPALAAWRLSVAAGANPSCAVCPRY